MKTTDIPEPRWSRNLRIGLHGGLLPLVGAAVLLAVWRSCAGLGAAAETVLSAADGLLLMVPAAAVGATAIRPWRGKLVALSIPYGYMTLVCLAFLLACV